MSLTIKHVIRNMSTGQYYNGVDFTSYNFAKYFVSEEVARTFIGRDTMRKGNYTVEKVYVKE